MPLTYCCYYPSQLKIQQTQQLTNDSDSAHRGGIVQRAAKAGRLSADIDDVSQDDGVELAVTATKAASDSDVDTVELSHLMIT